VERARRTIAASGVAVRCIESDLFGEVDGQYDLVLCNLPQTPTADLEALGYHPVSAGRAGTRLCWSSDGGEDGMAVLRPLVEGCPHYLRDGGRMLMAISPIHVDLNRLHDLVSRSGLRIERVHRLWGINSVYALRVAGGTASHRRVGRRVA
jgi:methylase of polypeptide subunit release factors